MWTATEPQVAEPQAAERYLNHLPSQNIQLCDRLFKSVCIRIVYETISSHMHFSIWLLLSCTSSPQFACDALRPLDNASDKALLIGLTLWSPKFGCDSVVRPFGLSNATLCALACLAIIHLNWRAIKLRPSLIPADRRDGRCVHYHLLNQESWYYWAPSRYYPMSTTTSITRSIRSECARQWIRRSRCTSLPIVCRTTSTIARPLIVWPARLDRQIQSRRAKCESDSKSVLLYISHPSSPCCTSFNSFNSSNCYSCVRLFKLDIYKQRIIVIFWPRWSILVNRERQQMPQ